MNANPESLKIKRVPRAFRSLAMKHNAVVDELTPLVNMRAGSGIRLTKTKSEVLISTNTR